MKSNMEPDKNVTPPTPSTPPISPTPPTPPEKKEVDDFTAAILTVPPTKPKTLEDKKHDAQVAMQGPELTAKREVESHRRALKAEVVTIKDRLEALGKEKEKYELRWVSLDEKRAKIKEELNPIVEQESKVEMQEDELEKQEDNIALPKERRVVEEKRWQVDDERRKIEKDKWAKEEKLLEAEAQIEADTKAYRALLDEEDTLLSRLEKIEDELNQD